MDDKPKRPRPTEQPSPAADDAAERAAPTPVGDLASEAAVAAPAEMVPKDTYLRLAAEYDNFRKRTLKERTELWSKAQADLVQRLVDALDDLARFAHIEPSAETAKTIHEGVDLVERKIWKELEAAGVRRVDQVGVPFDPSLHEAVTTASASAPEEDHTVGAVLQAGYQLGGALIRPARVTVLTWQGGHGGGGGGGGGTTEGGRGWWLRRRSTTRASGAGGPLLLDLREAGRGPDGGGGGRSRGDGLDSVPSGRAGRQGAGHAADGRSVPHVRRRWGRARGHHLGLPRVPGPRNDLLRAGRLRGQPAVPRVPRQGPRALDAVRDLPGRGRGPGREALDHHRAAGDRGRDAHAPQGPGRKRQG